MTQPETIISTKRTGCTTKHAFPFGNILDCGLTLATADYPACQSCAKKTAHSAQTWLQYYDGDVSTLDVNKKWYDSTLALELEAIISRLNYFKWRFPTFGYRYGMSNKANPVTLLATYEVISSSGNTVTLKYTGTGSHPTRQIAIGYQYENPEWPLDTENGKIIYVSGDYGSLLEGDMAVFSQNSIYYRFMPLLESVDASALTYEVEGNFTVKLKAALGDLTIKTDSNPVYLSFYRRTAIAEAWTEPVINDAFECEQLTSTFTTIPADGIFTLKDNGGVDCRIAIPLADDNISEGNTYEHTFKVVCEKSNGTSTIYTSEVLSRVCIHQSGNRAWQTKLYLGTKDYQGNDTLTSLLTDVVKVTVEYWHEYTGSGIFINQGRCAYCQEIYNLDEFTGCQFIETDSTTGRKFVCRKRNATPTPSGLATFKAMCYQYGTCDQFVEQTAFNISAPWLNDILRGTDVRLEQTMPGTNQVIVSGQFKPSIMQLTKHFRLEPPTSYRPKKWFINEGGYGYQNPYSYRWIDGAVISNDYDFSTVDRTDSDTWAGCDGVFPLTVTNWKTKPSILDYTQNMGVVDDEFSDKRLDFSGIKQGYQPEEGTVSGTMHDGNAQRIDIAETQFIIPNIIKGTDKENDGTSLEFGSWDAYGNTTAPESAVYTALLTCTNPNDTWTPQTKVSGTIAYAEQQEDGSYTIDCELGVESAGRAYDREDIVEDFGMGGNIVDLPPWLKVNNYYADNIYGNPYDKAVAGDTININSHAQLSDHDFFITRAQPCAGTAGNYNPGEITISHHFTIPGGYISSYTDATNPIESISDVLDAKLFLVTLQACPTCGQEQKFFYNYNPATTTWTMDSKWYDADGHSIDNADMDFTYLKPPGMWDASDMMLAGNEVWLYQLTQEENEAFVDYWALNCGQNILDRLDGTGDYKLRIRYRGVSGYEEYELNGTDEYATWQIEEEAYDSLSSGGHVYLYLEPWENPDTVDSGTAGTGGNGVWTDATKNWSSQDFSDGTYYLCISERHIRLIGNSQTTLLFYGDISGVNGAYSIKRAGYVEIDYTSDTNPENWYSSSKYDRNKYTLIEVMGSYYIRFHLDFSDKAGKYTYIRPATGLSSSDYFDAYIANMPGLPGGSTLAKTWMNQRDVLTLNIESQPTAASLIGETFSVSTKGVFSPTASVTVSYNGKNEETDSWTGISSDDTLILRGSGKVFLSKNFVDNTLRDHDCLQVQCKIADKHAYASVRVMNDYIDAIRAIEWITCSITGTGLTLASECEWWFAPSSKSCNATCLYDDDQILGLTQGAINNAYDGEYDDHLLLGSPEVAETTYYCNSVPWSNLELCVENEGIYYAGGSTNLYVGCKFLGNIVEGIPEGEIAIMASIGASAAAFNLPEINNMVDYIDSIEGAVADISIPNFAYHDYDYVNDTDTTSTSLADAGLAIFGTAVNGDIVFLGNCSLSVLLDLGSGVYRCDITDLVKAYHSGCTKEVSNIIVCASPKGFNIADVATFTRESFIQFRDSFADYGWTFEYNSEHPDDPCYGVWKLTTMTTRWITFDTVSISNIRTKFVLKDTIKDERLTYNLSGVRID